MAARSIASSNSLCLVHKKDPVNAFHPHTRAAVQLTKDAILGVACQCYFLPSNGRTKGFVGHVTMVEHG
jgi:hypothetical protein